MDPAALPTDVEQLLRERIGSYEQLHLLLLLFKDRKIWSTDDLATHFKLSAASASTALSALTAQNLVVPASDLPQEPRYRYASGTCDTAIAALERAYQDQPIAVIRLLAQRSIERIRADALRAFADAFLFRKGK